MTSIIAPTTDRIVVKVRAQVGIERLYALWRTFSGMVDPVLALGLIGIAAANAWIEADRDKQKHRK